MKNKKGAVIKIDLSKAYDRINWSYIRLILTHLGFKVDFIRWVMGCITDVSYAILINGASTPFFKGKKGLRQGCPLSPFLFLLVVEGLSQLIHKSRREGKIKGIEAAVNLFISHLLFVDDILVFTNGSINELKELKNIFVLFMKATGMQINPRKSQIIVEGLNRQENEQFNLYFPYEMCNMVSPFKYLGFWLKPNDYRKEEWSWIIAKIEARIRHWSFKWLSRAGRLTLIKSVLLAIPVYWAALTWVPKGVLEKLRRICCRFLCYALSPELVQQLEDKGLHYLIQVANPGSSSIWGQAWKNGEELDLEQRWWNEWSVFTQERFRSNVRLNDRHDELIWAHADSREYAPKSGYNFLMSRKGWGNPEWWSKQLWKLKSPPKSKILFWCILKNKIPTWDILQTGFMQGPGRCTLCKLEAESINHLFLKCTEAIKIWGEVGNLLNKKLEWEGNNVQESWRKWWNSHPNGNLCNLPLIISWGIWIARNRSIFQDKGTPIAITASQSTAIFSSIPEPKEAHSQRIVPEMQITEGIPWAFFDGASQNNKAGAGLVINETPSHVLKASVGLGTGTNNFVELLALKFLICWLIQRRTLTIQIFGDSQIVIRWVNGQSTCNNQLLKQILGEIQRLKSYFNSFSLRHIYRETNDTADKLSKDGLQQDLGSWKIVEEDQGKIKRTEQSPYNQPI
eukprot:PITA_33161